jgi:hypothetical protein
MRHPNAAATKEAAMANKLDLTKLCWMVMALGSLVFLAYSALLTR